MVISVKKICCIGAGYVGGPTMTVMASKCPDVIFDVVDINKERIASWNNKDLSKFVTKTPFVVNENMPASKVLSIMAEKRITSLLVVSDKDFLKKKDKKLKGIIHIHFLLRNGIN